jgi:glutaredoxin
MRPESEFLATHLAYHCLTSAPNDHYNEPTEASMPTTVTLYTKPGCHLCEDVLQTLREVGTRLSFELKIVDIEQDDALQKRYMLDIPVVCIDGEQFSAYFLDKDAFEHKLKTGN